MKLTQWIQEAQTLLAENGDLDVVHPDWHVQVPDDFDRDEDQDQECCGDPMTIDGRVFRCETCLRAVEIP
jgi:hypothetical protein